MLDCARTQRHYSHLHPSIIRDEVAGPKIHISMIEIEPKMCIILYGHIDLEGEIKRAYTQMAFEYTRLCAVLCYVFGFYSTRLSATAAAAVDTAAHSLTHADI